MGSLTIGEVASRARLQPSALRYYEQAGLVPPPARVNGRRRYEPDVLQRLAIIQLARQAGFTLAEVRTLFEGLEPGATPVSRWKELAEAKLPEIEDQIRRAEAMRHLLHEGLRCDCITLESCGLVLERLSSGT